MSCKVEKNCSQTRWDNLTSSLKRKAYFQYILKQGNINCTASKTQQPSQHERTEMSSDRLMWANTYIGTWLKISQFFKRFNVHVF